MRFALKWLKRIVIAIVLFIVLLQAYFFLHIVYWKFFPVNNTAFMQANLEKLQEKTPKAQLKHQWVDYEKLSNHLKRGVIAAEDGNFLTHNGVDWAAIDRAKERNLQRGKVVSGGSTITMQLAKNLFLSGKRSYVRKGQEIIIAYMLETVLSKRRIMEIYLNSVEFGVGVFGAQAASQYYYRVNANQLSIDQAARLVAMLPSPKIFDRNRSAPYLDERAAWIAGWIPKYDIPK